MEKINKINPAGFLIPGFMFIGIGIGYIFEAIPVGIMIGLGTGILLSGIFRVLNLMEKNNGKENG